ncbi:MAG: M20/M25/M40 family metallo-hydrolase [Opitutaceae bacterium]|nr:M20/M25/M40 family metallo-hydrolase [Opitutaceae bacterium]
MRLVPILLGLAALSAALLSAAPGHEATLSRIAAEALARGPAYDQLRDLLARHPGRLGGSEALAGAVRWSEARLQALQLDRVWLQEVMVPHWERGHPESVQLMVPGAAPVRLAAAALGGSVATPAEGLTAPVIEVDSLEDLMARGEAQVAGKVVFLNRPMDPADPDPGRAYGKAVDQRSRGPRAAASLGAVAALVRSMTQARDDVPHTGGTAYLPDGRNIPAAALSAVAADRLSAALKDQPDLKIEIKIHARWHPEAVSHNVIGEIRGTEKPGEIIVVGAHLDSWDITPGAHDDGAGVVQAIEVLRIYRALGLQPRHTIRCVLFTNEENGLRGGKAYAAHVQATGERHVFAVESDGGGFAPRGFSLGQRDGPVHERARRWLPLLEPLGILAFTEGRGGADIGPLLPLGVPLGNLLVDDQRYFDLHHTVADTIDQVHPRELHLGAAALASLVWLVDQEGL